MRLEEAVAAVGGDIIFPDGYTEEMKSAALKTEICGAVTDNRKIEEGGIFVPVVGARVDGHSFMGAAYEAGALACFNEQEPKEMDGIQIMVDSTLEALKRLAAAYRRTLTIPIVGIVGSVGKTSTKEMVASVLSQKFNTLKTEGNLNNEIGLPLTIMSIRPGHEAAVVEMGISDFGEMDRLGMMAEPNVVVMTNIGQCHMEFLHDRDGILNAKTEVFDHLAGNALLVLNGDDDKLSIIAHGQPAGSNHRVPDDAVIAFFGMEKGDAYASDIRDNGLNGIEALLHVRDKEIPVNIPIPGLHNVANALAACLVADSLGLNADEMMAGVNTSSTISGRSNLIRKNGITIMDDCYNASPTSMKASLKVLSSAEGRRIAVLGDMGELGEHEADMHYDVGKTLATLDIDMLYTCGELSKEIVRGALDHSDGSGLVAAHFDSMDELIAALKKEIKKGDTVLIKASHFMNYSKVVKALEA